MRRGSTYALFFLQEDTASQITAYGWRSFPILLFMFHYTLLSLFFSPIIGHTPVDELIDGDEVAWCNLFPQTPTGRGSHHVGAARFPERPEVGAVGHVAGHQVVPCAVSAKNGEKIDKQLEVLM